MLVCYGNNESVDSHVLINPGPDEADVQTHQSRVMSSTQKKIFLEAKISEYGNKINVLKMCSITYITSLKWRN